jgi:hypothetical protein
MLSLDWDALLNLLFVNLGPLPDCKRSNKGENKTYWFLLHEVADELVTELTDPRCQSPSDQQYDQKNIRRRVYDALNVRMVRWSKS